MKNYIFFVVALAGLSFDPLSADECITEGSSCPTISEVTQASGGTIAHYNGLTGEGHLDSDPWTIVVIDTGVVIGDPNLSAVKDAPSGCFSPDMTCSGMVNEAINGSALGLPLSGGYGEHHGTAVASVAAAGGNNTEGS